MHHLSSLETKASINRTSRTNDIVFFGDDIDWEGPGGSNVTGPVEQAPVEVTESQPVEKQMICLPSNGNTAGQFLAEELVLREEQAEKHLTRLRELIADKSFQYSALVRTGNQPQVRTRARTAVQEMNAKLAIQARMYNRVRCRLVMLGAGDQTLQRYRLLERDDIAASTAILNYNEPGSTTAIRLSWIWQSVSTRLGPTANPPDDPTALLECKSNSEKISTQLIQVIVKRVHWLRGRALSQRWTEENKLVNNEMQWTVRYFLHKAAYWQDVPTKYRNASAGAVAYAARQSAQWKQLADGAHMLFTINNPAYEPPRDL